jgi:hypothetical protein
MRTTSFRLLCHEVHHRLQMGFSPLFIRDSLSKIHPLPRIEAALQEVKHAC